MSKLFDVEAWVTQWFGFTDYAKTGYSSGYHNGLDVVPEDREHWALYAPSGGQIMATGVHAMYGKHVIMYDERLGIRWRFAHLDIIDINKGQTVEPGQLIGVCGSTGNSTARHLHIDTVFMNCYPEPAFPGQPTDVYSDPLPILRCLGVHI